MTRAPIRGDELARRRPRPRQPQAFRPPRSRDHARPAGGLAGAILVAARGDPRPRARRWDCRRDRLVGLDAGDSAGTRRLSRPRGPVGPRGARHRRGRASSLSGVRDRVRRAAGFIIAATAWLIDGLAEQLGADPFDVLFLPINGRDPARGVPGNMTAAEAVDLAGRVRPRFVVPHHYDMFTFNTVPVDDVRGRGAPAARGGRAADPAVRRALGDHAVSITLGIDIGTSGTKTLAIDETGTILASASAEYPCDHPRPGWSEQDPELWWEATAKTIRPGPGLGPSSSATDVAGSRPERPDARLGLSRRGRRR